MTRRIDLSQARVLISNDDGIHAPGLAVLERVARKLAREVIVVAPESEQSAASHSLTMRRPLFLRALEESRYAVDGTPTDCVLVAVHKLLQDRPPDLVLSGINRGGNLGEDATYSGTVAAAMEGILLGIPSIAISQLYQDGGRTPWETAEAWTETVLRRLADYAWPAGVLLNVNIPCVEADAVSGIEVTRQGRHKIGNSMVEGTDPRGQAYYWISGARVEDRSIPGSDLEAVHRGAVSITPMCLELTHEPSLAGLSVTLG